MFVLKFIVSRSMAYRSPCASHRIQKGLRISMQMVGKSIIITGKTAKSILRGMHALKFSISPLTAVRNEEIREVDK